MPSIKKVGDNLYDPDLKGRVCPYPQMYTSRALTNRSSVLKIFLGNPPSVAQKAGAKSAEASGGAWEISIAL
jgi:TusA-related sulfurtransferase